ncbi:MAG: hypothetical protein JSR09_08695 [Bacteroidetes bacterium]|nr:hypothetical protein [Bacteroidota bacterium]MBS1627820.1 hypothetical protein [Bacteroidota bacterium]MBS1640543.1 hypothetical protein [Bacteroidota bacterium]MBS1643361.1 hypothetical protein [Bacteroidota bacterium]MBS1649771.1 hypothetical protein [Bacteroidota bacterium]
MSTSLKSFKIVLYCIGVVYLLMMLTSCNRIFYPNGRVGLKEMRQIQCPGRI